MGDLLEILLEHQSPGARIVASATVAAMTGERDEVEERPLIRAGLLMDHTSDASWAVIWPAMQRHPAFGRKLVERVAPVSERSAGRIGTRLEPAME